ncbi:IspD/TarI family cytidylyltransferase [soil metagenome]
MSGVAIVLAGGSSSRLGSDRNKPYLSVGGRPLIWYPLVALAQSQVEEVVLVIRTIDRPSVDEAITSTGIAKLMSVVEGGTTRTASEHAGLAALAEIDVDVIMIHDAARPFVTPTMIDRLASTARSIGGAVPVLDPNVTPWRLVDEQLHPTRGLVRAQTPQAFRSEPLRAAYNAAARAGATGADTVDIVQRFGNLDIAAVEGDPRAFKVTHPDDLVTAEAVAVSWITELGGAQT